MTPSLLNKSTSTSSLSIKSITPTKQLYTFKEALILLENPDTVGETRHELSSSDSGEQFLFSVRQRHPDWKNWEAVWKQEPFELDLDHFLPLQTESVFPEALFRISPDFPYATLGGPLIYQGATFVFTGFDCSEVRHVVEWCEHKDDKYAYLRLVGVTHEGRNLPYNHYGYPTFILVVPQNISTVPFYPHSSSSPIEVSPTMSNKKMKTYMAKVASGWKKRIGKFFTI